MNRTTPKNRAHAAEGLGYSLPDSGKSPSGFLTSKRIYLREVRAGDVNDNYYRWLNDPEVTRFLEIRYTPHSLEDIRGFVAAMDGKKDEIFLAICLRENDRHIGNIKLGPINPIHRFGDISLLIGAKDCWGKGYATEAIVSMCRFAFAVLNLRKVNAGAYAANTGSIRAFEKAGFSQEGRMKGQYLAGGVAMDQILLGLCAEEFTNEGN